MKSVERAIERAGLSAKHSKVADEKRTATVLKCSHADAKAFLEHEKRRRTIDTTLTSTGSPYATDPQAEIIDKLLEE